jgi:hypothetical protein
MRVHDVRGGCGCGCECSLADDEAFMTPSEVFICIICCCRRPTRCLHGSTRGPVLAAVMPPNTGRCFRLLPVSDLHEC